MADPGSPSREGVTGVILAGGAGRRMGGRDKGLETWRGQPLVQHVLDRLAPQVAGLLISANRHLDRYRAFGAPVVPDRVRRLDEAFAGPLAGLEAALAICPTPWMLSVPCDCPALPADLLERLAAGLAEKRADLAIACTPADATTPARRHPVFCLLPRRLAPSLANHVAGGGRKVDAWTALHRRALVEFPDTAAFRNLNRPEDLAAP